MKKVVGHSIWLCLHVLGLIGAAVGWPIWKAIDFYENWGRL